jgi:hypothetical protein
MNKNNPKLLPSKSSSKKPPLPFGFPNTLIGRNNNLTFNNIVSNTDLLTPYHRPASIDNNASVITSHSRSPSTSSMIFGTIESNDLNADNLMKTKNLSPSILSKTKSIDAENTTLYSKNIDDKYEKNENTKAKLKSTSLSSNLSSHTGSMTSKLNKDLSLNSFNKGIFTVNEKKFNNPINTGFGFGRSSTGASGASASGIAKKKKLASALTLPSFLTRKRHSIESLIEYCKIM